MKVADEFVKLDLKKYGYEYINIDDCWCTSRNATTGELVPDPKAFPDGMKAVADYVHKAGYKFGMYTDRGPRTCAGRPASGGHETTDAKTFAGWGVDYLKEDSCNAPGDHPTAFKEYGYMRAALNATGREIYFSLCGWNSWYAPVGATLGNSWRIAGDCNAWPSVWNAISVNSKLAKDAGPGGWNDPVRHKDYAFEWRSFALSAFMLIASLSSYRVVCRQDMLVGSSAGSAVANTPDQARTQFSLWSVMAAPLLIGSNILNLSPWDLETYTNAEVIAVDQDPLGAQGTIVQSSCASDTLDLAGYLAANPQPRAYRSGEPFAGGVPACQQVWSKAMADTNTRAMAFVNYDASGKKTVTCDAACLKGAGFAQGSGSLTVRDLWAHKTVATVALGANGKGFSLDVGANGASRTLLVTYSPSNTGVNAADAPAEVVYFGHSW